MSDDVVGQAPLPDETPACGLSEHDLKITLIDVRADLCISPKVPQERVTKGVDALFEALDNAARDTIEQYPDVFIEDTDVIMDVGVDENPIFGDVSDDRPLPDSR